MVSDIFVCNSFIESFPRVVLEAMAWQLPIVATNVFGIPEQIRNGTDGILVAPGNNQGLEDALLQLIDNPTLAKQMAANARDRVVEKFTLERMVESYENLFHTIANR